MPDESKKNDKRNAKEQRKPRQRHQQGKNEKTEPHSSEPKVPQKPPVYESPPPEFYQNLKRETDEILKITEDENSKYKKKEIQSNWSKYEVPIDSYEEIDEQENLGADYEKLIAAPLSLGGHFQFKHEKSWDINSHPSLYDKYFEINMEDLNNAVCTIPFYDRIEIEKENFTETDILSMDNRSTRFKHKYYNDKSYSTYEMEAQNKILGSLREGLAEGNSTKSKEPSQDKETIDKDIEIPQTKEDTIKSATDINLELKDNSIITIDSNKLDEMHIDNTKEIKSNVADDINVQHKVIFGKTEISTSEVTKDYPSAKISEKELECVKPVASKSEINVAVNDNKVVKVPDAAPQTEIETKKEKVIESPEDLEKWLDDFLDG